MSTDFSMLSLMLSMRDTSESMLQKGTARSSQNFEDKAINGLEYICSIFDNVQLLRTIGVIGESNVIYQKLIKGDFGSKLWLATLLLSSRRLLSRIVGLIKTRFRLKNECGNIRTGSTNALRDVLMRKLVARQKSLDQNISLATLELLQNFFYLVILLAEILKLRLSGRQRKVLNICSALSSILGLISSGVGL
ncbi:LAMI_0F00386g1_1 [Lachancea mirantina]|uniref:LAMI_0F00386g1_1 n=1 Tax=Lachancea mirantina TaxID=1230905 RepID=A0A1G4JVH9_9SACH|nr:LAMI_0F00386g1_1 [Lachancea mirantina]